MNVYFLVEGRRCERRLYPAWLSALAPHLQQVKKLSDVKENNFVLFSGEGYPSIIDIHLANAIKDVERLRVFDVLVVVLDADEEALQDRLEAVEVAAGRAETGLTSARLEIVVQFRCIETWLLGNRKICRRNPESPELRNYVEHYDTRQFDPEAMPKRPEFTTHAQFHCDYLKAVFRERRISYTKTNPGEAATPGYLSELVSRTRDCPEHLRSFSRLLEICRGFS